MTVVTNRWNKPMWQSRVITKAKHATPFNKTRKIVYGFGLWLSKMLWDSNLQCSKLSGAYYTYHLNTEVKKFYSSYAILFLIPAFQLIRSVNKAYYFNSNKIIKSKKVTVLFINGCKHSPVNLFLPATPALMLSETTERDRWFLINWSWRSPLRLWGISSHFLWLEKNLSKAHYWPWKKKGRRKLHPH